MKYIKHEIETKNQHGHYPSIEGKRIGSSHFSKESKHVLDLKKRVANKMKSRDSLKSHGKNEGERMMGNNTTERNRS